jgi:hypothetical protein
MSMSDFCMRTAFVTLCIILIAYLFVPRHDFAFVDKHFKYNKATGEVCVYMGKRGWVEIKDTF